MATIRPAELPAAASVNPLAALVTDDGAAVEKATPLQVVDAAVPLASQVAAEAGADNTTRMSPLRVKQAIDALGVSAEVLASAEGGERVGNEIAGVSDTRIELLSERIKAGELTLTQFEGDTEEEQLVAAIEAAGSSYDGAQGHCVRLGHGVVETSEQFNNRNRCLLKGWSKRGSILRASALHAGPSMVEILNGTSSTFDNRLQEFSLDCNDVADLTGVIASAWQEGGGARDMLFQKFRGYAIDIIDTIGGVAALMIENSEFMGSAQGALGGIRFDDPSPVSSCILQLSSLSMAGGAPVLADTPEARATARASMPACIDVINGSTTSVGCHFEVAERGFRIDGNGFHIIDGAKGSAPNGTANAGVETLVEVAATFTGTLIMRGCRRNGATNLLVDLRTGGWGTVSVDRDIIIRPVARTPLAINQCAVSGVFNGTAMTISSGTGFSIARTAGVPAGSYDITLSESAQHANDWSPGASQNGGYGGVRVINLGVNSFRLETYNAASPPVLSDANQIKFWVFRNA